MSQLVTAKALARKLKVKPATVLAWARRGLIPRLRAGQRPVLFDPAAVEAAMSRSDISTAAATQQELSRLGEELVALPPITEPALTRCGEGA